MAKKKKVRVDRLIILILSCLVIVFLLIYGATFLIKYLFNEFINNEKNSQVIVEDSEDIKLSLYGYDVYFDDTEELGFNFIIANINFKGKDELSFDLNNLSTSQKISLADESYLNKINEQAYDLSSFNLQKQIICETDEETCNILIPFNGDLDSLVIYNSYNQQNSLNFDLTKNIHTATSLKLDTKTEEIEINDTIVAVSSSYISTEMLCNNEEYILGSNLKVFTFRISGLNVEKGIKIVKAQYLRTGQEKAIECLSEQYESLKDENVLNKELINGENGSLFFEVRTNENEPNYDGVLLLKFNNSDKIYEISTQLR